MIDRLLVVFVVVLGCDDPEPSVDVQGRIETGTPSEAAPPEPEADEPPPSVPDGWVAEPSQSDIPEGLVHGIVDGRQLSFSAVYFEPRFEGWALVAVTDEIEDWDSLPSRSSEYLELHLPDRVVEPGVRRQTMGRGHGFLQIRMPERQSLHSWSGELAFVLELAKWEMAGYDREGELYQRAGTASGRFYVSHRGSEGHEASWVGGTFDDVVVRYRGVPSWVEGLEGPRR